jgi:thiol-disulfide isomerase/thioredoxin
VKYRYAEDLLEYAFHHSDLPSDYYSFEEDFKIYDEYAIQCSQYYEDFIGKYYLQTLLSREEGFNEMLEHYYQQTYQGLIAAIDFLNLHLPNSIVKDVSITQLCYNLIGSEPQVVDSAFAYFSNIVTDVTCQNFIAWHVDEQLEREIHSMSIEELTNLDYIGSVFSDIQKTCAGKALFIDYWGTWCGSCLGAFPHTQKLYESLNSKPVEFIYLCMSSNEDEWQNTITKYKLEGKHYNLSRDQSAVLRDVFHFNGVPRYMLVDKDGQFVDYDAKDPYSEVLKEDILNLL